MPTSFRFRFVLAVLAGILLMPMAGCDLISKDSDDGVEGVWLLRGDDVIFLVFSGDTITDYDYMGDTFDNGPDCYNVSVTNIIERDGEQWTVAASLLPDVQLTATVRQDGDTLTFSLFGETAMLDRSDRSVSSFVPVCDGLAKGNPKSLIQQMQNPD